MSMTVSEASPYEAHLRRVYQHRCRSRARILRDQGHTAAEIMADAEFRLYHRMGYYMDTMAHTHARSVVYATFAEKGKVLNRASYGYRADVPVPFGDGMSEKVWLRATEDEVMENPTILGRVMVGRLWRMARELESLPEGDERAAPAMRALAAAIGHAMKELDKITS